MAEFAKSSAPDQWTMNLAVLAGDSGTPVRLTPEKLFGRHCAILGATGGGKSWTIARIMESLHGSRAKVILLDATDEYHTARSDVKHVHFGAAQFPATSEEVVLPYKAIVAHELVSMFRPSGQAQGPKLRAAIKTLKLLKAEPALGQSGLFVKANQNKTAYSNALHTHLTLRWWTQRNRTLISAGCRSRSRTNVASIPIGTARRAQALAHQTGLAFRISRELIDRKLAGQERVAQESLQNHPVATLIRQFRSELAEVESIDTIRVIEARAAKVYWKAWRAVAIIFPDRELPRTPEHWRTFGSRVSPLSGSPRLAANPVNAILNYLYALLEAECRLAVAALGLDPGMGVLHMDTINRDSLACDLMEPTRPDVDAYVLNWILHQPLKRNWFFEERNGNCRLMADLASQLAETASTRLVAPLAEWAVKEIASTTKTRKTIPATRLTQNHKRALTGRTFVPSPQGFSEAAEYVQRLRK
jgi:CRISPR-associated endonuclease Cas1